MLYSWYIGSTLSQSFSLSPSIDFMKQLASALILFGLAITPLTAQETAAKKKSSSPNILFIFSDDHALQSISAYGGRFKDVAPTPNLDRLAAQGAIFENSFCANSICGPTRACILTGKHSHINGFMKNGQHFDGTQWSFQKDLGKAGYSTALIGKWHLHGQPQGFDHWEILPGQGNYYHYWMHGSEHVVPEQYGVRTQRYKLIHYPHTNEWDMFDLEKDPNEMKNIYSESPEIRKAMEQELDRLRTQFKVAHD